MDLFFTNMQIFVSQDMNWWLLVDYYNVFISCLDSHSDGTHSLTAEDPLVNSWCNATFLRWNKLIYILDGLRVSTFSANFNLGELFL